MVVSFLVYDIVFLVIFAAFLSVFLYSQRKNLKREGLLLLYKARWGIRLIDYIGKKSSKTFHVLSYISIATGYLLMVMMFYLIGKIVYIYLTLPSVVQAIKVPPIIPLVPYLPQVFKLDFLPPFYFTYWIIIIAVIAISHEFAHGIFASHNKLKTKSTGFGFFPFFLPIFLAAFVELDEKKMAKKKKFSQLAILSAGTFANLLTAILFFAVIWVFFILAFTPSGIIYDGYPYDMVDVSGISIVNGVAIESLNYEEILNLTEETGLSKIKVNGKDYVTTRDFLEQQRENSGKIILYYDAPAINSNLESVILKVNGIEVKNIGDLNNELLKYKPEDKITLNVLSDDGEDYDKDIVLGENPRNKNSPFLGIAFSSEEGRGILGKIYSFLNFKEPNVYYKQNFEASLFVYNLLWWLVLISISVALINMLPVGIFDGGRFFYLTIWGITKNEKLARNLFKFTTYFILFLLLILMLKWAKVFFF
tara:strand:- start:568 stop:2001 length:1434 start_codon:yes stop_codon:yes gene_type:complete